MTIQEKIKQLRDCLSNTSNDDNINLLSQVEREDIKTVIEEATKIFELGDISRMDPELLEEVYKKWDSTLDTKLSLFPEFNQSAKHHI